MELVFHEVWLQAENFRTGTTQLLLFSCDFQEFLTCFLDISKIAIYASHLFPLTLTFGKIPRNSLPFGTFTNLCSFNATVH